MQAPQDIAVFEARPNRWLRREGVRGPARVRLNPGGIGIIGSEGGALEVVPARVSSLRVGTERLFQRGFHEMRVRLAGKSGSLILRPYPGHVAGFGAVSIGLARAIEAGGHPARLELGESLGRVLFIAAVLCLPLAIVVGLLAIGSFHPGGTFAALLLAVPGLLALAGLIVAWRGRPRLAKDLTEFEAAVASWVGRDS
jgi:hypothetical protein